MEPEIELGVCLGVCAENKHTDVHRYVSPFVRQSPVRSYALSQQTFKIGMRM